MGLFDSIRRWRLTQKGLSSGKRRRTQADGPVASTLDRSSALRYSIYGAFAVVVSGLVLNYAKSMEQGSQSTHLILSSLMVVAMTVLVFELCHTKVVRRNGHVLLVFSGL